MKKYCPAKMHLKSHALVLPWAIVFALFWPMTTPAELATETIPNSLTLPEQYPDTWVYLIDINFFSITDGRIVIVDVAAENHNYKGMVGASQMPSFAVASSRSEFYVAETFFSRGHRGEQTDVISIYDKANLTVTSEIILPGSKRSQSVTLANALQLIDDEKLLVVFNLEPATSVTIVDLIARKVVSEIPLPGCALIYPLGQRGFSSLCGDGSMLNVILDESGAMASQSRSEAVFDIDADPVFPATATIDGISYFLSFKGQVTPLDMRGDAPQAQTSWSFIPPAEQAKQWRPGGWQIISGHADGLLYVLMHEQGKKGTHKNGGSEIWVLDVKTQSLTDRITLKTWGISVEVTKGAQKYLTVTNRNFDIDVYDAASGAWLRTIGDKATQTAFLLHAVD